MNLRLLGAAVVALMLAGGAARADGELHIFNWGDYTSPKLIENFQKQYNVKVTIDDYDSNETMLAKVRAGATGYDIVVPSDYMVKIMIEEDMLAKTEPNQMENFKNVDPKWVNVYWDSGPALHGAMAVGHDIVHRRHGEIQRRHQHAGHPVRSAAGAAGPHQRAG